MLKHIFNGKMVSRLLPFSLTARENQPHFLYKLHSVAPCHAVRGSNWGAPSVRPLIIIYAIVEVSVSQAGTVLGVA